MNSKTKSYAESENQIKSNNVLFCLCLNAFVYLLHLIYLETPVN